MDQFVINWERNNTMGVDIKKGDKFRCTEDVRMGSKKIAYIKDKVYTSDNDCCITDESGNAYHLWQESSGDYEYLAYFVPITGDVSISEIPREVPNGKRLFDSGAVRDSNEGKPLVHTLLGYTRQRFGYHMTKNAKKYGAFNFLKGIPTEAYLESIDRHLAAYMAGDRSEDHLSSLIFGVQGLMLNEEKDGVPANHYMK